ncbi:hypothetical protein KIV64_gp21 [Mycobacterium phage DroogsArmy]|uniref:Uncharacterized protein n=2 Tax=Timshelvirus TaxID=2948926 RepID=G1DB90_9CAUD|nr:hypothetical protein FDI10_gp22 [Mycobacterium phage Timshel]YP_010062025.1 hypothetical protein KIV64_gp21 [Mycobacterium phage DroogsArmy]AEJ92362.1 hypothetical protein TIMSHEL_72 [Mycobacterium phage Timshel]QKO02467.1 hypothetical protein SEA_DROOGSARMY_71 [Mycobacterium phage DroogsArmy]
MDTEDMDLDDLIEFEEALSSDIEMCLDSDRQMNLEVDLEDVRARIEELS